MEIFFLGRKTIYHLRLINDSVKNRKEICVQFQNVLGLNLLFFIYFGYLCILKNIS